MGLLALGTPLEWPEAKKAASQVREWGIEQLLALWNAAKGKENDSLLWGDEIEYLVVNFDDADRKVKLSLRQADILRALAEDEKLLKQGGGVPDINDGVVNSGKRAAKCAPTFHPEFGRFMLEATPGKPWGIKLTDLLEVEDDMKWRRIIAKEHMEANEFPVTLTTFPRLGQKNTLSQDFSPSGDKLRSQFLPDEIANPHIRFPTLAANIRARRGKKVEINVPVFKDEKTPSPFNDPTVNYDLHQWPEDDDVRYGAAKQDHIYMDAMAFGMGSCCLQITFQAKNIEEGRKMYDQLSPLGPIMLALTAATPIYKGFLADTDVRWNQISRAVDDRTDEELGNKPLTTDRWRIPKSRYASNSTYISQDSRLRPEYHDPNLITDPALHAKLVAGGMDPLLATHFAHLFIRDPIVIFAEDLRTLDLTSADHFENLQSTNWQHMRFKPPPASPPGSNVPRIGWRVEFRSMEIQMTDFENAAFAVFIVLVTRAILSFDLNFYVPIARTTENMETAHKRDAVLEEKFWFRRDPWSPRKPASARGMTPAGSRSASRAPSRAGTPVPGNGTRNGNGSANGGVNGVGTDEPAYHFGPVEDEYTLMTVSEIINGSDAAKGSTAEFPGLIPLVEAYLDSVNVDVETRCELGRYLDLIRKRADGRLWTGAKWIREFVRKHEEYGMDSVVGEGITYDLCKAAEEMASGKGEGEKRGVGWEMLGSGRR